MPTMSKLATITKRLGAVHAKSKEAEKELKVSRSEFFEAVDEEIISTETLARQTITFPATLTEQCEDDAEDLTTYVKRFYPGWRIAEIGSKENICIIEEDPSFKKFVYVNHEDGNVYRRNVSQGDPSLDDDRLKSEDPELWERITEVKIIPRQEIRVLKDLETLPNQDFSAIQEYLVPGPMTVKLDAPRKAKPDELDA